VRCLPTQPQLLFVKPCPSACGVKSKQAICWCFFFGISISPHLISLLPLFLFPPHLALVKLSSRTVLVMQAHGGHFGRENQRFNFKSFLATHLICVALLLQPSFDLAWAPKPSITIPNLPFSISCFPLPSRSSRPTVLVPCILFAMLV